MDSLEENHDGKKMIGSENYVMADCPFHLPKQNLAFFQAMQKASSGCQHTSTPKKQ